MCVLNDACLLQGSSLPDSPPKHLSGLAESEGCPAERGQRKALGGQQVSERFLVTPILRPRAVPLPTPPRLAGQTPHARSAPPALSAWLVICLSELEREQPFGCGQEAAAQSAALDPSGGKSSYGLWSGSSPAQPSPARGGLSGSQSCGSSGGGGGGGGSGPALFGDGYSWVDNTDYVVIA